MACGDGAVNGLLFRRISFYGLGLVVLLLLTAVFRLYRIDAPVVDGFWDKQVAVANKARNMAGPPFTLLDGWLDFCVTPDGQRLQFTEEVPLYVGIVALGYRAFGEQDWFSRMVTAIGSLVAVGALASLLRRECGDKFALVAAVLFASCPLLVFYGRAVMPDVCMLACMLLAAAFYRRFLDEPRVRWLVACGLAGMIGAGFKYYGLMVLLPIAELAHRRRGWRALLHWEFLVPVAMMVVPLALWMLTVFVRTPNPTRGDIYLLFQQPDVLWRSKLLSRLFGGFFWKDCGPVTLGLMVVGAYAIAFRSMGSRSLWSWLGMGLLFYFLLAPKSVGHEYYALMLLPSAAICGAVGWTCLWNAAKERIPQRTLPLCLVACLPLAAIALHSPYVTQGRFRQETGFVLAGRRLDALCSPQGRVVAGPVTPQPIIHYAHREGWTWHEQNLTDWRALMTRCQKARGEYVALYFDHRTSPEQRASYAPMLAALPLVEHQTGPFGRGGEMREYFILKLHGVDLSGPASTP
jgi:4-amino-4-deoxy-L-arabinose transferase-like glycosyltransferase